MLVQGEGGKRLRVPSDGGPMVVEAAPYASITLVHAPACHLCEDAERALAELGHDLPIVVERIDATSARGVALVQAHRSAMYPLVLVDGALFSSGRLPRRKLRRLLETTSAAGAR